MVSPAVHRERLVGASVPVEFAWVVKSAVAGAAGGAVMALFAMFLGWAVGEGLWAPVRAIPAAFFGEEHFGSTFSLGPAAAGAGIQLALAAVAGLLYAVVLAAVTRTMRLPAHLVAGLLWGAVIWMVNTYLLAPMLDAGDLFTVALPGWAWFAAHVVFGAVLGIAYGAWRGDRTVLTAKHEER